MPTTIHIREMKLTDAIAVTRLHRNTIRKINSKDYPKRVIEVWSGRANAQRLRKKFYLERRYVAVINQQIVGFLTLSKNGKTLQALYVRQKYMGRGVGNALIKKAEQVIRQSSGKKMVVTSTLTARPFYEKHGLNVMKPTANYIDGVKIKVWQMEKSGRDGTRTRDLRSDSATL